MRKQGDGAAKTTRRSAERSAAYVLPIFPSDDELLRILFGREAVTDGGELLRHLERDGFPRGRSVFGGRRYLPAVLAWCERYDSGRLEPSPRGLVVRNAAPDGPERF